MRVAERGARAGRSGPGGRSREVRRGHDRRDRVASADPRRAARDYVPSGRLGLARRSSSQLDRSPPRACRPTSRPSSAASTWRSSTRSARSCSPRPSIGPRSFAPAGGIDLAAPRGSADTAAEGDYLNCPFTKDEYARFVQAIVTAEKASVHDFDNTRFFEGCLPVEVMAHRGLDTLRFGPMKPVGLRDPQDWPAALRRRPAPAGQPRRRSLQPRGIPDAAQVERAGARVPDDSWSGRRRVRPVRHDPPQHLHQRADDARRDVADASAPRSVLRGPGLRRRGLRRVRGFGLGGRMERGAAGPRGAGRRAPAHDRAWARSATTSRTPIRVTTSRRTSRSASCRPSRPRSARSRRASSRRASVRWAIWRPGPISTGVARARTTRAAHRPETGCAVVPDARGLNRAMLKDDLGDFIAFLRLNRNVSPHTVRAYESDLGSSPGSSRAAPAAAAVRSERPRSTRTPRGNFWASCTSAATAARRRPGVWPRFGPSRAICVREGRLQVDPTALVGAPRREETLPAHLGLQEMDRLLAAPDAGDGPRAGGTARFWSCSTRRDFA